MNVRADTARLGERLQYATILWNSAECVVALAAGFVAGSIALVGFGFDSALEVTSSVAALWRLRSDRDEAAREAAERRTLRIIGVCFLALAAYVTYGAARDLLTGQPPEHSLPGIVIAALSLIVMPLLVRAKRRVAAKLQSGALEAEARQTRVCAYLSAILLLGLGRERGARLVVGRPYRRAGHGAVHRVGRQPGGSRQDLLQRLRPRSREYPGTGLNQTRHRA